MMWAAAAIALYAAPATAEPVRDQLAQVSFGDHDKTVALRRIEAALAALDGNAGVDAAVLRATALGYRAKLTGSRADVSAARRQYESALAAQPHNAEAQLGLGAWNLSVVFRAGTLLARVLGASRGRGEAAFERAVALGGDHALYPGLAALFRIRQNPADARGRQLAEQAARAGVTTPLDRVLQRSANAVLVPLRAGRPAEARALAQRLLPLGAITGAQ